MDIYIQSCGKKETQDYRWLKIYEDDKWLQNPERKDPPFISNPIKTITNTQVQFSDFYKPSTPAVILARNNQELMLLIYWLRTKERSLEYGRLVHNSLALISKDNQEDNLRLQMLASEALKDWEEFAKKLDCFVKWDQDNEHGFKVEESQLLEYIQNQRSKNLYNADNNADNNADKTRKLACDVLNKHSKSPKKKEIFQKTAQKWIKDLAEELEKTDLPTWDGPLVVVAENVAEEVLKPVVWRGISDRVEHNNESEDWKEVERVAEEVKKKSSEIYLIFLIMFVSCLLIIAVVLLLRQPQNNPNPQPSLPQTHLSPTPPMIPEAQIQPSPNAQMTPELTLPGLKTRGFLIE
jgi:hypothetical protein